MGSELKNEQRINEIQSLMVPEKYLPVITAKKGVSNKLRTGKHPSYIFDFKLFKRTRKILDSQVFPHQFDGFQFFMVSSW